MHFQMTMNALNQPVIRIRQRAVCRNAQRAASGQQQGKARMFIDFEAPAQRVTAQAIDGQRHQPVAVQLEQRHCIARQQVLHGV